MKDFYCLFQVSILVLVFSLTAFAHSDLNRIEGRVYDPNRNPVVDVDVELLNDVNSLLNHTKTDSSGRFSFIGVSSGRFIVRVLAFRLNLREETQSIEVNPPRTGGSDIQYADFYLRYDKRTESIRLTSTPDAIFVQEVPQSAKELYEKGINEFDRNPEQSFNDFEASIKIFPNYFDALSTIGKEYINRKNYEKGYPYLLKAIDINPRSLSSYYSLGYAFLEMKQLPAALEAAKATVTLNQSMAGSQLLYGTILRLSGNYDESEKALIKAKGLAKKPDPEIHYQLALLYNKLKRNQEAANELDTYLKVYPKSPIRKQVEDLVTKLRSSK